MGMTLFLGEAGKRYNEARRRLERARTPVGRGIYRFRIWRIKRRFRVTGRR